MLIYIWGQEHNKGDTMQAFQTFLHSAFFSGLVIFAGESLVVTAIIWAESRAERKAWEKQETRKMKAVRR